MMVERAAPRDQHLASAGAERVSLADDQASQYCGDAMTLASLSTKPGGPVPSNPRIGIRGFDHPERRQAEAYGVPRGFPSVRQRDRS